MKIKPNAYMISIGVLLFVILLEIVCSRFAFNPRKYLQNTGNPNTESPWIDDVKGWDLPIGIWASGLAGSDSLFVSEARTRVPGFKDDKQFDYSVSIYGASYAFGQGINNHDVFSAKLSNELPNVEINNKSVPAYSTVQMLYKFKEDIELNEEKPDLVLLSWLHFHAFRNTNSTSNKAQVGLMLSNFTSDKEIKFPVISISEDGFRYSYADANNNPIQKNWFLSHSALVATVYYIFIIKKEDRNYNDHFKASMEVIRNFNAICKAENIKLCVIGMNLKKEPLINDWCKKENICYHNMGIECENSPTYSQDKDPFHPNELAHEIFFNKTAVIIKNQLGI